VQIQAPEFHNRGDLGGGRVVDRERRRQSSFPLFGRDRGGFDLSICHFGDGLEEIDEQVMALQPRVGDMFDAQLLHQLNAAQESELYVVEYLWRQSACELEYIGTRLTPDADTEGVIIRQVI
jgi:hypothetical protein